MKIASKFCHGFFPLFRDPAEKAVPVLGYSDHSWKWIIDVATRSCNAYPCKDTQISPSCWHHASDPPKVVERTAPGLLAHHPDAPEPWDRIVQACSAAFGTTHAGEIQDLSDKPLVAGCGGLWEKMDVKHVFTYISTIHIHTYPKSSWVTAWT